MRLNGWKRWSISDVHFRNENDYRCVDDSTLARSSVSISLRAHPGPFTCRTPQTFWSSSVCTISRSYSTEPKAFLDFYLHIDKRAIRVAVITILSWNAPRTHSRSFHSNRQQIEIYRPQSDTNTFRHTRKCFATHIGGNRINDGCWHILCAAVREYVLRPLLLSTPSAKLRRQQNGKKKII